MEKVLIFKTASDNVMNQLFDKVSNENAEIDCLIQNSLIEQYKEKYENINFINIYKEGFYNVSSDVIDPIKSVCYNKIFIPLTGAHGHNFGNIIDIITQLSFKNGYFYNCNGELIEIPQYGFWQDWLCRCYIRLIGLIYGKRER